MIEIKPDQFAYRTEDWYQPSISGDVEEATPERLVVDGSEQDLAPRTGTREVWFSPQNRGSVEGDDPAGWPPCTAADYVVDYAIDEYCWRDIGGPAGAGNYLFEAPPGVQQVIEDSGNREGPPFWEFSPDIAELGTDPEKIDAAVTDLGRQLENGRATLSTLGNQGTAIFIEPTEPDDSAFKLRAVADLLANPLAPPDVRAALFEYAGGLAGVETSSDATDPQGRHGASISITSTPADPDPIIVSGLPERIEDPLDQYKEGGYRIDLSGLTLRTEIIFDPETSGMLSERIELISADDPLLGPWLEREGAPQTIYSRTFEPITVVATDGERPNGE
ncbi:MAG: hypothetical protein IT336_17290 [Thermomicrobiales bacterium]|nr:hypothetical protein [Thermomicrobiales bacterium]